MQLKTLIPLALAGVAWAGPTLTERDLPTITNAVDNVNSALQSLDASVKNFNGASQVGDLQTQAENAQKAIDSATSQVQGTSTISLSDALALQQNVQDLVTTANTTVDDLIAKKDVIDQAGVGGIVYSALQAQQSSGSALANAITSKVPSGVSQIAGGLSSQMTDALNRAIAAFQDQASATGAAGASSTAAGSAPAATTCATTETPAGVNPPSGVSGTGTGVAGTAPTTPVATATATATATSTGAAGAAQCPCLASLGNAITSNMQKRDVELGSVYDRLDKRLQSLERLGNMLEKRLAAAE